MWADLADEWFDEYVKQCPRSILQTVSYESDPFDAAGRKALGPVKSVALNARLRTFGKLDKAGFEVVACGSRDRVSSGKNFSQIMKYAKTLKLKHLAGGLQASCGFMLKGDEGETVNMESVRQLKETVELWKA
jgi:hypothetical protein